jgi:hypothetical protein
MSEEVHGTPLERLRREVGELRTKLLEIDRIVGDLEIPGVADEPSAPPPSPMNLQGAAQAVRSLILGRDQTGILERLLEETTRYCARAVLFLEGDEGEYRAWRAQGLALAGWERTEIPSEDPLLDSIREQQILEFDLGSEDPPRWMLALEGRGKAALFPMSFGSRIPVILYVDGQPEPETDSVELLVEMARLVLQNQYLGQMVQAQEQGGPMPSRWPTLENLSTGRATPETAEAAQPTTVETPTEEAAGPSAVSEPEHVAPELHEEASEFEPLEELPPSPELQPPTEEAAPLEPAEAQVEEAEGFAEQTAEQSAAEHPPEAPAGESAWTMESKADLKPEDLGLSEDEFNRLMGQASTDWLEAQKARQQGVSEAPLEEQEPGESGTPPVGTEARAEAVEEPEQESPGMEGPEWTQTAEPEREKELPVQGDSMAEEAAPPAEWEAAGTDDAAITSSTEKVEEEPAPGEEEEPSEETAPEILQESEETTSPEEVLRAEAHRFARLLVAEIKLYNEQEVEAGRQNGDLYIRLKNDIDRSRDMYEKRIHPSVKASTDYFHAQLVQVLAQDDEGLMGEGYPGPQVAENA